MIFEKKFPLSFSNAPGATDSKRGFHVVMYSGAKAASSSSDNKDTVERSDIPRHSKSWNAQICGGVINTASYGVLLRAHI